MEVRGQFHAPAALHLGKNPWYPLKRRLHFCTKNFLPLPRTQCTIRAMTYLPL
jgi:hypothetical protein